MRDYCKFCWSGTPNHTDDCPRDTLGAEERYQEGYRKGRSGATPASADPAYRAGYRDGEIAYESWYNGHDGAEY